MRDNDISQAVIGAAIEVQRETGPGLVESVCEEALCHELHLRGTTFLRHQHVPISYKGVRLATPLRLDLLIEKKVIVALRAKEQITGLDKMKGLTYLRLCRLRLGLLINLHTAVLHDGIKRAANNLIDPDELRASPIPLRLCVE